MLKIVVASNNPVKIQAAQQGFARMFNGQQFSVQAVSAPSGVSAQPFGDQETLQGAMNRTRNARQLQPAADYWVGIEGGVEESGADMLAYAWVSIAGQVEEGWQLGRGRTTSLLLPPAVSQLVRAGAELGEADDVVFGRSNSKQENGAIGLLTHNVIDRTQAYVDAVILALIPFKNPHLYPALKNVLE